MRLMTNLIFRHDGGSPLGRAEIALRRRLDTRGAIRVVDAAQPRAGACLLERGALFARFHAGEEGTMVSGATAFAAAYLGLLHVRPALQRAGRRWVPS
jgi:hypothetical protein